MLHKCLGTVAGMQELDWGARIWKPMSKYHRRSPTGERQWKQTKSLMCRAWFSVGFDTVWSKSVLQITVDLVVAATARGQFLPSQTWAMFGILSICQRGLDTDSNRREVLDWLWQQHYCYLTLLTVISTDSILFFPQECEGALDLIFSDPEEPSQRLTGLGGTRRWHLGKTGSSACWLLLAAPVSFLLKRRTYTSAFMNTSTGLSYLYPCHSKPPDSIICNITQHDLSEKTATQVSGVDYLCALGHVLEDVEHLARPVFANSSVWKQWVYQLQVVAALGGVSEVAVLCPSLDPCPLGPACLIHGPLEGG